MASPTTWQRLIEVAMAKRHETFSDLESCTLTSAELMTVFDAGSGATEGKPFTAWSSRTVYFPLNYDGYEWVGSVSRHPDGQPTEHQGGGG